MKLLEVLDWRQILINLVLKQLDVSVSPMLKDTFLEHLGCGTLFPPNVDLEEFASLATVLLTFL